MPDRATTRTSATSSEVHQKGEQATHARPDGEGNRDGRSARKRRAIMEAATASFLRDGYRNTSMDQVAADAAVSKQTVYKHFADKEQLFREIVLGVTGNSEAIIADLTSVLRSDEIDSAADLRTVLTDLARTYFEQAPSRGIDVIADALRTYERRGFLDLGDAQLAAAQFAYLVLGIPQDRAQFCPQQRPSPAERDRLAAAAVRVFLAAYQASHPAQS